MLQFYRNPATGLGKIQFLKGHIFFLPSWKEGNTLGEKHVSQTHFWAQKLLERLRYL